MTVWANNTGHALLTPNHTFKKNNYLCTPMTYIENKNNLLNKY